MGTEVKKVVGYFRVGRAEDAEPSVEELLRDMRRERAEDAKKCKDEKIYGK